MVTLDEGGRGIEWQRLLPPPVALRPFVEHFWIQARPTALRDIDAWRVVPDLSPHLILHCGSQGWRAPRVVGPRSVYADVPVSSRRFTVGCRLRPGALMALYGIPAELLADTALPLSEFTGRREFLFEGGHASAAVGALCEEVSAAARHSARSDRAVRFSRAAADPKVRVSTLAADLGCSERSLRRFTRAHIGLAPKTCARIVRLQGVLAASLPETNPCWSTLAFEAGYADQAHLIRDSQELLGETPAKYQARGAS